MKFSALQLMDPILKALQDQNYTEPTSIQEQAIPPGLAGRDLLASAQTGTGKTAAFAIPIIQQLSEDIKRTNGRRPIASLIVTPTRELAIQIGESLTAYAKYTSITNTVIFGGVNQNKQTRELKKGVDILVATPGRLLDLMNQGFIALDQVRYFVLDEGGARIQFDPFQEDADDIDIGEAGNINVNDEEFAVLGVVEMPNQQQLFQESDAMLRFDGVPVAANNSRVMQGVLEQSNVRAIDELVELTRISRSTSNTAKYIEVMYDLQRKSNNAYAKQG
jgi:flagellar basal body rod protein FlgC